MDPSSLGLMARSVNQTLLAVEKGYTCPVEGNADLYGLGIRVGIYIQMLAVQLSGIASSLLPMDDTLGEGTILFVLSTAIVLVKQLVNLDIQPVEAFFVITLLLVQIGVCRGSYRSQLVTLISLASFVGLTALFVWFWWHGMDTLPRACKDDKAFFFAKVSIWHWFRTFNKVTSIMAAMAGGMVTIVFIVAYCLWGLSNIGRLRHVFSRREHDDQMQEAAEQNQRNQQSAAGGSLDLAVNIGIIVYVEMALRWNKISGVHDLGSPGQFMPLFIALAQLLSLFYGVIKTMCKLDADESQFEYEDDDDLLCSHDRGRYARGNTEGIALNTIRT